MVIHALQNVGTRSGNVQLIIEDVLALIPYFESLLFSFCYRECNEVAHRLAKWVVSSFSDEV